MKAILTATLFLFLTGTSFSQNNYEVTNVGSMYSEAQLLDALNNANMCGYYYSDTPRVLYFNDGSTVQLAKATDLSNLDSSCVTDEFPNHQEEIWEIASNGFLIKRMVANPTK